MKTNMLPKKIIMPPRKNWIHSSVRPDEERFAFTTYFTKYVEYFLNTAIDAGIQIEYDDKLSAIIDTSIPFYVDGAKCIYNWSDYSIVPSHAWDDEIKCFFMIHHLPLFKPYKNLGSIPQYSFLDWEEYREISAITCDTTSNLVLHCQNMLPGSRRDWARKRLLKENFNLWHGSLEQKEFWRLAQTCQCSVHIPGSTENCMDRGQLQLMGLGVCTISPDLFCSLGAVRAEPDIHYIRIRDDMSDLTEKVKWCLMHKEECDEIGKNAKKLFQENCTPVNIWKYIKKKTSNDIPIMI